MCVCVCLQMQELFLSMLAQSIILHLLPTPSSKDMEAKLRNAHQLAHQQTMDDLNMIADRRCEKPKPGSTSV